jgi:hypothetical protein
VFALAYLLGFYALGIYLIGVSSMLFSHVFILYTAFYLLITTFIIRIKKISLRFKSQPFTTFQIILFVLLGLLAVINLIGALGPELAFDALWYHLTLPKIYLEMNAIQFIPGGLLYYSAMPKLGEMFYIVSLMVRDEILAKLVHFSFGILATVALFQVAKKYYKGIIPVLISIIFYSNFVVSWMSITAYIDLIRTFYEFMAFWAFINWYNTREKKWLLTVSLMLGFAIATKLLALGSLVIFISLFLYTFFQNKKTIRFNILSHVVTLVIGALLIPLPWFVMAYSDTGNPVYPFFTKIYPVEASPNILNPLHFFSELFTILTKAADPLSPVYIAVLPLGVVFYKKFSLLGKIAALYTALALVVWYITPRTGGGRFLLPYLPVLSLFVGEILMQIRKHKSQLLYKFFVIFICVVATLTLLIRGYENAKFIPVIMGFQSKDDFLTKNLNFSFGDFYDTDGFFKKTITPKDRVLLIGFHNIYYVNFPFIHESYLKEGDRFNYIAVQGADLPKEYNEWHLIYNNPVTKVKVYKKGRFVVRN